MITFVKKNMFSKGQFIFAILFFVVFIVAMTYAFRKDMVNNESYFKGSYKVLIFIVLVLVTLFMVVKIKRMFFLFI